MKKSLMALALSSLTLLSACSDEAGKKTATANCGDPAVLQNVRDNLMQTIKQEARLFAQKDGRQFIDADKVIAAASDLHITTVYSKTPVPLYQLFDKPKEVTEQLDPASYELGILGEEGALVMFVDSPMACARAWPSCSRTTCCPTWSMARPADRT